MRDANASDFCYYPFMQILMTSDGKYRPCSKHQDYITHNGRELNIQHGDTLQDAWSSDYMEDIRKHFLENEQFKGCRECWRMQKMGLRSMRFDSYQYETPEEQVQNPIQPTRIEINASNICNLKCRICYPNASSKWIKEHGELYGSTEVVYRNLNLNNLNQVKQWADSLEEVCFFGGEPLLSDENLNLLDYFIASGYSSKMSLLFNTNGTVFSAEIADRLSRFKRVRMYYSVDDIGSRFEYQRKGAVWNDVADNIQQAYSLSRSSEGTNIDFKICCTVSIFNIYYFPEYFKWFGERFPGLRIFWNLLFDPWRLNVQILPKPVKTLIINRLENHVKSTYAMSESETKTIQELVTFLNEDVDKPFQEFFYYVNRHDTYRSESFPSVFKEFWEVIEPFAPDDLKMGLYTKKDVLLQCESASKDSLKTPEAYAELERLFELAWLKVAEGKNQLDKRKSSEVVNLTSAALEIQITTAEAFRKAVHLKGSLQLKLSVGQPAHGDLLLPPVDLIEFHGDALRAHPNYLVPLYGIFSGKDEEASRQEITDHVLSKVGQIPTEDTIKKAKALSVIKVFIKYDNEDSVLTSILLTSTNSLGESLQRLEEGNLVDVLENDFQLLNRYSAAIKRKLNGGQSSFGLFSELADVLADKSDIDGRWKIFEGWVSYFAGSEMIVPLFRQVVGNWDINEILDRIFDSLASSDINGEPTNDESVSKLAVIKGLLGEHNERYQIVGKLLQTPKHQLLKEITSTSLEEIQRTLAVNYTD